MSTRHLKPRISKIELLAFLTSHSNQSFHHLSQWQLHPSSFSFCLCCYFAFKQESFSGQKSPFPTLSGNQGVLLWNVSSIWPLVSTFAAISFIQAISSTRLDYNSPKTSLPTLSLLPCNTFSKEQPKWDLNMSQIMSLLCSNDPEMTLHVIHCSDTSHRYLWKPFPWLPHFLTSPLQSMFHNTARKTCKNLNNVISLFSKSFSDSHHTLNKIQILDWLYRVHIDLDPIYTLNL